MTEIRDAAGATLDRAVVRRQMDERLMHQIDADHDRIRETSSRLTRMEVAFTEIIKDLGKVEERVNEMFTHLETLAKNMTILAQRFESHAEMEERQWVVVNKATENLDLLNQVMNRHLQDASALTTRISGLERLIWALWGVVGAGAATLATLALKTLGAGL